MQRCHWVVNKPELYQKYHDEVWGTPVYDDLTLFKMLFLECFQAGLSWYTILKKEAAFSYYFDNFDPVKIAQYDQTKIDDLLTHPEIIRHQLKIKAAINNAQIFLDIQQEFSSFSNYLWGFTDHQVIHNQDDQFKASTPLSDKISQDLKKRGMKFVGSITIYSFLQAVGVVNDHDLNCERWQQLQTK